MSYDIPTVRRLSNPTPSRVRTVWPTDEPVGYGMGLVTLQVSVVKEILLEASCATCNGTTFTASQKIKMILQDMATQQLWSGKPTVGLCPKTLGGYIMYRETHSGFVPKGPSWYQFMFRETHSGFVPEDPRWVLVLGNPQWVCAQDPMWVYYDYVPGNPQWVCARRP